MRAIKIDSESKTISVVHINEEDKLKRMQDEVGGLIERAFEFSNGDELYVNEEGLLCSPEHFFSIAGGHQPFAGNGLIIGINHKTGESIDANSSLDEIRAKIKFLSIDQVRRMFS
jgi:Domain of unknown function (DUF3846)